MADFGFKAYDVDNYSDPFVFISYKREDSGRVAVYAKYLHDNGLNVWYDNGIHGGDDWESYIMSVIEKPNCRAVLLFVSAKVAESSVIPLETTCARQNKKPTVAVYLEPGLDLEKLLNKAIKIYVSQRQSVDAFVGGEKMVCTQVLNAARNAMTDKTTAGSRSVGESKLWDNALIFIRNAERMQREDDINKARGFLRQMTENTPADYRGWLGLAMCECVSPVRNLNDALVLLKNAAGYYSYVMAADADSQATGEYTRVKSHLWQRVLNVMQSELMLCRSIDDLRSFNREIEPFANFFGHTEAYIKNSYESIVGNVSARLQELEKKAAEEARLEAEAESRQLAAYCEWERISDTEVRLRKYNGELAEYKIPEYVEGAKVTEIGDYAFFSCHSIKSIIIPDSVANIGEHAFAYCDNLAGVNIPKGVISIGKMSFIGCHRLTGIEVSPNNKSYKSVDGVLFTADGCTLAAFPGGIGDTYTVPDGVKSIGESAFSLCLNLSSVIIPNSVTSIGENAFFRGSGKADSKKFIIYCSRGSCAWKYCRKNKHRRIHKKV